MPASGDYLGNINGNFRKGLIFVHPSQCAIVIQTATCTE